MSLFSPGGPGDRRPADRPPTRLTVRLPKSLGAARIVALHGRYGQPVAAGARVMTLRVGDDRHVLNAPRAGRLMPMAGPGDEVLAGDALFALHFEPDDAADGAEAPVAKAPHAAPAAPGREAAGGAAARSRAGGRVRPASPRGRHVPVLGTEPAPARKTAQRPAKTAAAPPAGAARESRGAASTGTDIPRPILGLTRRRSGPEAAAVLLRVVAALLLFVAGAFWLLPLMAEFGFGGSAEARLAITLAALALGLLLWRLLALGCGRVGRIAVGAVAAAWSVLVVVLMTGFSPVPLGPVSLSDTHALAPASRTRVPPARPSSVVPTPFPGILGEPAAGSAAAEPAALPPLRFTGLPTTLFALPTEPSGAPAPAPWRVRAALPAPETRAPGVPSPVSEPAAPVTAQLRLPDAPQVAARPAAPAAAPPAPSRPRLLARLGERSTPAGPVGRPAAPEPGTAPVPPAALALLAEQAAPGSTPEVVPAPPPGMARPGAPAVLVATAPALAEDPPVHAAAAPPPIPLAPPTLAATAVPGPTPIFAPRAVPTPEAELPTAE